MTEWWSIPPQATEGETPLQAPARDFEPGFPVVSAPDRETEEPSPAPRSKGKKIAAGVAGAVVVGVLAVNGVSGNGSGIKGSSPVSAEWTPGASAAGADLPAAGGGPAEATRDQAPAAPVKKEVTLTATPSGKGRIGAVVTIAVHNGTDRPVMVLASLVKGDDRPAVVGEGTLSPGSRVIAPGDTAEGTVEFPVEAAPSRIALVDLRGNIIAKEGGNAALEQGGSTG